MNLNRKYILKYLELLFLFFGFFVCFTFANMYTFRLLWLYVCVFSNLMSHLIHVLRKMIRLYNIPIAGAARSDVMVFTCIPWEIVHE